MPSYDQIQKKAKSLGLKYVAVKKKQLIKNIQHAEGNFPCFSTAEGHCYQTLCIWRNHCLSKKN